MRVLLRLILRWLGWDSYQGFVARRYLLVRESKIAPSVRYSIIGLFLTRLVLLGVAAVNHSKFLWGLERITEGVLIVVVVLGVLRYSKLALWAFIVGSVVGTIGGLLATISTENVHSLLAPFFDAPGVPSWFGTMALVIAGIGGGIAGLAMFFGMLRAGFTFFTTVPIGGVWIGTMALVCVLSVMSGFESDLRDKILGTNAHINVTREDGDMNEWRTAKSLIDAVPGVIASTPYAQSEVVIAANNNGMPVIIKGIDPKSVGTVTKLVDDICLNDNCDHLDELPHAEKVATMTRLDPLVDDSSELHVQPRATTGNVVDPAPTDLPSSDEPIDFSQPAVSPVPAGSAAPVGSAATGSAATGSAATGSAATGSAATGSAAGSAATGSAAGSAARMPAGSNAPDVIDLLPPHHKRRGEIIGSDAWDNAWGSARLGVDDPTMRIPIDASFDAPAMSRRTQSLPGVLVGKELVKQTHLYVGEEVRVVSPLSDPSNPDATGTPIPFNRDYRVAGEFFTGMYEYDLKYVYVTLDSFQEFLDRGDSVDGIEVRITSPDDTDLLVPRISAALGPGYRVQSWKDMNRSLFSALKLEKIAMFLVLGIVILVASFSIVGNLIMVVVEKGREIALLKTLGASDASVMQLFAIQGLLIGLIGTTLGVLFGLGACYLGKHYGIPLNPDVYYIDRMPVHVDASSVIVTFLAGVVISIAATFYPALLAARIRPAAGIRH